jgi:hypothetical protein
MVVTNAALIAAAIPKFLARKFTGWVGGPRGEILAPSFFVRGYDTLSLRRGCSR